MLVQLHIFVSALNCHNIDVESLSLSFMSLFRCAIIMQGEEEPKIDVKLK